MSNEAEAKQAKAKQKNSDANGDNAVNNFDACMYSLNDNNDTDVRVSSLNQAEAKLVGRWGIYSNHRTSNLTSKSTKVAVSVEYINGFDLPSSNRTSDFDSNLQVVYSSNEKETTLNKA